MSSGRKLLQLLQLNGGTFPTGGFSQSWGLETYVAEGRVRDGESFRVFLESYLISSIGKCEGPVICRAYDLAGALTAPAEQGPDEAETAGGLSPDEADAAGELSTDKADAAGELRQLEALSNAVKVTGENREAGLRMGRAFARIAEPMMEEGTFQPLREVFGSISVSYPVMYGCVCRLLDLELEDALTAYIFSAANTLTQSGLKLIPLGNVEAQKILFEMDHVMEETGRLCRQTGIDEISNFCPGIDIASLKHEELPVRLYMS